MTAGLATERFWRLTVPEVYREVRAINDQREFAAAMCANVANYAGQSLFKGGEQATMDKFLGRDRAEEKKGWAEKAYMYFDMSARSGEMEGGDG